ncbi:MFS transporter [Micromonospora sp. M12]
MKRSASTSGAVRVAFAFWITLVGTTVPTPLYPLYEMEFGFSSLTVTVVYALYALGVVVGLLVFGRLSDQIGRRPVILAALLLSVAADAVFLAAVDLAMIIVGRILAGLSAALIIGAATAALAELIDPRHPKRAATVSIFANLGGLATGTLLSGIVSDVAPDPLRLPWVIVLILAVIAIIALRGCRRRPGAFAGDPAGAAVARAAGHSRGFRPLGDHRWRGLRRPRGAHVGDRAVPRHGPARDLTHPGRAGGLRGVRRRGVRSAADPRPVLARRAGLRLRRPGRGAGLLAFSMWMALLATLLISAAIIGVASGVAVGDGIATITMKTEPQHRAEAVSTFFAILFVMLGVPAVGVGLLIQTIGLRPAGEVFSAVVAVLALVVLLSLLRRDSAPPAPTARPAG